MHQLTKEQLQLLKRINKQGIYLISKDTLDACKYLKGKKLISILEILTVNSCKDGTLDTSSCDLVAQIEENGKAYLSSSIRTYIWEVLKIVLEILSIVCAIINIASIF